MVCHHQKQWKFIWIRLSESLKTNTFDAWTQFQPGLFFACVFLMDFDYNLQFGGLLPFNCRYYSVHWTSFPFASSTCHPQIHMLTHTLSERLHYFSIHAVAPFHAQWWWCLFPTSNNQELYHRSVCENYFPFWHLPSYAFAHIWLK